VSSPRKLALERDVPTVTAKEFFDALWGICPEGGYVELSLIRPKAGQHDESHPWFSPWPLGLDDFMTRAKETRGQWNSYFGVGIFSRMRGRNEDVLRIPSLWCDIDFKDIARADALAKLKEFPHQPSAGILSGGGLHLYWFLQESMEGKELANVRPLLLGIARYFGGDKKACTLKQILRIPNTFNIKYDPPRPVSVAAWYPDRRYNPDDFEMFVTEEDRKPQQKVYTLKDPGGAGAPGSDGSPRQPLDRKISTELAAKLTPLIADMWVQGFRNSMSLYLAGLFAHGGYSLDSALHVVRAVCLLSHDEEGPNRERNVQDTYAKYLQGQDVCGAPTIEKMIESDFPEQWREKAKKLFDLVRKSIPKGRGGGGKKSGGQRVEPDFDVVRLLRYESLPSKYEIRLRLHADKSEINVDELDAERAYTFRNFRLDAFNQHHIFLASIDQQMWEEILSHAPLERLPAPLDAHIHGTVESALESFMLSKKENPEIGDLKSFPGFDENQEFFGLGAFKTYLKNTNIRSTDRDVCNRLRKTGYEPATKRFGHETAKVWWRPLKVNGQAAPQPQAPHDLFGAPDEPTPPAEPGSDG
jgi:hypothetical protein